MKTLQQKIEVMQAFASGQRVEVTSIHKEEWKPSATPTWAWDYYIYRIAKPEPKKIKLSAYLSEYELRWLNIEDGNKPSPTWIAVPSEDKEITLP